MMKEEMKMIKSFIPFIQLFVLIPSSIDTILPLSIIHHHFSLLLHSLSHPSLKISSILIIPSLVLVPSPVFIHSHSYYPFSLWSHPKWTQNRNKPNK
eukprot:m.136183 g.136183  ORF g.136183 m.136183 type:complete len:97 (+) comp10481_c0_seq1:1522-1812(+)